MKLKLEIQTCNKLKFLKKKLLIQIENWMSDKKEILKNEHKKSFDWFTDWFIYFLYNFYIYFYKNFYINFY